MNKWLKTPDVDGRYQLIVRDFQAAIPEVLDALPRKYFQQPVSWITRIFHQFDDVSLMAAQGIAVLGLSYRIGYEVCSRSVDGHAALAGSTKAGANLAGTRLRLSPGARSWRKQFE
jgi:hypothetical protein